MTPLPRSFVVAAGFLSLELFVATMPVARALVGFSGPQREAPLPVKITWLALFAAAILIVTFLWQRRAWCIRLVVVLTGLLAATALLRPPGFFPGGSAAAQVTAAIVLAALNLAAAWQLRAAFRRA